MILNNTTDWSDFLQPVLSAYNNTKLSATGVAPTNNVNSENETQIAMKLRSKTKPGSYPDVNGGVRIQMIHKTPEGLKQQWSTELHAVQNDYHNGVYKVDNQLYPREEIQLVKVIK